MKIFVLTDIPSPYQTEIFNEIVGADDCELHVGYLRGADPARRWNQIDIRHESTMLDKTSDSLSTVAALVNDSDLAVFNYYFHPQAEQLITQRANQSRPWCFWGERPGFRKPEWVGRLLRHWKLRPLYSSAAPIWGIGKFAVDQYKREFGPGRDYFNLPYFSNLERFNISRGANGHSTSDRVFVYSGALIPRKGVDVLALSFEKLVCEGHKVRLRIVGDGPLRSALERSLSGIADRVDFVGFKDWKELPQQYAKAQILCVPSRYDGWGLVVPEGLAAGLPVIATDRMGAALEFVETGHNGWLVRAGDSSALTSAMTKAASISSAELTVMSSNACASVREHTLENGARRFLQYANDVVTNWQVQ